MSPNPCRHKFVWTRNEADIRRPANPLRARLAVCALTLGLSASAATPSSAQIYSWRDPNGTLVLSNRRPDNVGPVKSFSVPNTSNVRVTRYAALERSRMYDDLIDEHARRNGVRPDLVRAVVQVESAFNPYAKSPKGAMGLMQLMPATMRQYGVTNAYNPIENVRAGVAYLRELLDRYQNNEELALAAYNAGPGAVDKHGQNIPPYRETRNYVAQIGQLTSRPLEMRSSRIYKVVEIVDGQPTVRYTDQKPKTGSYELVVR
jgi:soluble lytic murein transglycosylase-like protein